MLSLVFEVEDESAIAVQYDPYYPERHLSILQLQKFQYRAITSYFQPSPEEAGVAGVMEEKGLVLVECCVLREEFL